MARRRMISENILYDPGFNSLSMAAQNLFIRLLIKTDDYGIIPADEYALCSMLNLPLAIKRTLPKLLDEIEAAEIGARFTYESKVYFLFKRERFDEYQSYLLKNRTRSEYLRLEKDFMEGDGFREILGTSGKFPQSSELSHRESISIKIKNKDKDKEQYGEFVFLTAAEHEKLIEKFGVDDVKGCIEFLDNYLGQSTKNQKKYDCHYRVILRWAMESYKEKKNGTTQNGGRSTSGGNKYKFDPSKYPSLRDKS